jgi:hypothetical protein
MAQTVLANQTVLYIQNYTVKNVLTKKLQSMMMLMFSTLAISNTVQADFREYECRIENSYGEDTAKMLLLIEGEF